MSSKIRKKAKNLGIDNIGKHIFICCDAKDDKCVSRNEGLKSWNYLKKRLAELDLAGKGGVQRTKADCFRICSKGPIIAVYPDNIWYHSCDTDFIEKIIQSHIMKGKPLKKRRIN
jgi:(2Fe-2S) ferredoxin